MAGIIVAIHLVRSLLPAEPTLAIIRHLAFIPGRFQLPDIWSLEPVTLPTSIVAYAFLHADFAHLLINTFMLLAFGTVIARRMGSVPFWLFYLACAAASAGVWYVFQPDSITPLVGASGAISGCVGAVARITLLPTQQGRLPTPFRDRQTAIAFVSVYVGLNLFFAVLPAPIFGNDGEIAWEAHLGGFFAGLVLLPLVDGRGIGGSVARLRGFD